MSTHRQAEILHAVRQSGRVSLSALAARFGVSSESIRRDIKPLLAAGAVTRFHGGIADPARQEEPPFLRRMRVNRDAKRRIAALALDLIHDGDSLLLDNGTTTAYVAEILAARTNLFIVTNSAHIACRLAGRNNNRVFCAGGEMTGDDAAAFGAAALDFLAQFRLRLALLSAGSITAEGIRVFHLFEAEFARAAISAAQESWIIADSSKFAREAPVACLPLTAFTRLITDTEPSAAFQSAARDADVSITIPARPNLATR
jgi:DeoR family transcriptional regulator, glycerol-3-phosphate regulon repressor